MMRSQLHFKGNFFCKETGEKLNTVGVHGTTTMVDIATEIEN